MTTVANKAYNRLSNLGKINTRNKVNFPVIDTNEIGVEVTRASAKKATTLEIVVPARRSGKGSRRALAVALNGAQARALYETLSAFYTQE